MRHAWEMIRSKTSFYWMYKLTGYTEKISDIDLHLQHIPCSLDVLCTEKIIFHFSDTYSVLTLLSFCCCCSQLFARGLCWVCNSIRDVLWHNGGVTYEGIMDAEEESAFNRRQQIFPNGKKKDDSVKMLGRDFRWHFSLGGEHLLLLLFFLHNFAL